MKKIYILLISLFTLNSCGGFKEEQSFENEKTTTTDEFLVKKKPFSFTT